MGSWLAGLPPASVEVHRLPLTNRVDPVTPVSVAWHVECSSSPSTGPGPKPPGESGLAGVRSTMSTELVTDPLAPVVPWALTVIGPEGGADGTCSGHRPAKMRAGPYWA